MQGAVILLVVVVIMLLKPLELHSRTYRMGAWGSSVFGQCVGNIEDIHMLDHVSRRRDIPDGGLFASPTTPSLLLYDRYIAE